MNLLRGKSSERGSVVSKSERQCGVRVKGEWELLRLSVPELVRMLCFGWEVSEAECYACEFLLFCQVERLEFYANFN